MATFAEGSTGSPVKKLQIDLNTVMSCGLKTTGSYDEKTKAAVVKFQKRAEFKANGVADVATLKSLKVHIVGLDWPHGDPSQDQKSVKSAVSDVKTGGADAKKKFLNAEAECRAVAEILKKNAATLEAATTETVAKWTDMAKFCGEQATLKKNFAAAKKTHDLAKQKDILAKAKTVQGRIETANAKGYAKFEEMGGAARDCLAAIKRLAKLDGEAKKAKCSVGA